MDNITKGKISTPLKTSFGWKVFLVDEISLEKKLEYSEVKDKIRKDYIKDLNNERIYEKANAFYEYFLEDNNLEKALSNSNLSKVSYKEITVDDIDKIYYDKKTIIKEDILIKTIFNLNEKNISDPLENSNNSLVYVHIDEIIKPKQKTLINSKKEVLNILYKEIKQNMAIKISKDLLISLNNNKSFDKSLYTFQKTDWLTIDNRIDSDIDNKIKNIIFSTPLSNYSKITQTDDFNYVIVKPLKQIINGLKADKKTNLKSLNQEIDQKIDNDILNALLQDMKMDKKSSVNQNFLNSF